MSNDLRTMEWLWHVDLDIGRHQSKEDIMRTAGMAFDILKSRRTLKEGDTMVIVVVRPPKTESNQEQEAAA